MNKKKKEVLSHVHFCCEINESPSRSLRATSAEALRGAFPFCSSSSLSAHWSSDAGKYSKYFLRWFTKHHLLTSQENFGWDHKWILSTASGCMTCLYRQWSAYSGLWIPDVKEILDTHEKLMKTDLMGKLIFLNPGSALLVRCHKPRGTWQVGRVYVTRMY